MEISTDKTELLERNREKNEKRKKNWYIGIIVVFGIIIIAVIFILLFIVFDVFESSSSGDQAGMIGLWPTYGGNLQCQQTSPYPETIAISSDNIDEVEFNCDYESDGALGTNGYPTIDDEGYAYFTDMNGFVTSINMEDCQEKWRVNVAEILEYNSSEVTVGTHASLTLFRDADGNKGALFGAPSRRTYTSGNWEFPYPIDAGCWAIALDIDDGSLLWKLEVAEGGDPLNIQCNVYGYYVDGNYAYGGLAQSGNHPAGSQIIGRYFKIDINKHEVVDVWYPFDPQLTEYDEYNMSYLGAGAYNYGAIIDDYLIFGTGQLYRAPAYVEECLAGNFSFVPFENSVSEDVCGNSRENDRFWRCFEKDIYCDSLIILNKNTFEMQAGIPLQGADVHYTGSCFNNPNSEEFCPWAGNQGPNADLSAVAAFKGKDGTLYAAASLKPSRLYIFEVPSGKLVLAKKFGPFSGAAMFNMAVDEETMTAIVVTLGSNLYELREDYRVCAGGASVHAIDIMTGNTKWVVVNPYGIANQSICWDGSYSPTNERAINQSCPFGDYLNNDLDKNMNIIVPDIFNVWNKSNENDQYPLDATGRDNFRAPITIIKDMVFIAGETGDIWVHDLNDGHFIHNFQCPAILTDDGTWNRAGIKGGISVADKYILVYCGSYWSSWWNQGNRLMVLKLNE